MKLGISPLAEQDMEAIGDYIAEDNPVRAMSFTAELYADS
ncbi:type II toxin-antitoxin system RelE/ParE family toxin (plasmid) [Pantoea agglomerans]|jgi:plasmid stabilization system protein ParE|nr:MULTISPECIES: type II toxin-antitoxin system RelE/ParE family toxin [Pantoea]UIL54841.1 type II toxin-antitoxin system RelE/ParE family toxin [Pantoea agglomerans]